MSRELESAVLEADYWRLLLADLLELNNHIADAYAPIPRHGIGVLELMIGERDPKRIEQLSALGPIVGEVGSEIVAAQEVLMRMIDLAGGRCKALSAEVDLPARGSDDADER